ncbi:MAG: hypothetical protein PHO27_10000 [Sulfuricurvum sp.]|nr:hypothetical protein [Sulfuricurvum sp.]
MTNKERFIHNMHQSRTAHIRWVNSIKLLMSGINVDESDICVNALESEFGKWFYNEAMLFSLGSSRMVLEDIEMIFISMHDKYTKIYPIYFGKQKKNLLGNILGRKSNISDYEKEFSERYYEEIVVLSDKLKHKLRILEAQMMSITEDRFDEYSHFTENEPIKAIHLKIPEPEANETSYYHGARSRG